jgi:ribosomal protein S21
MDTLKAKKPSKIFVQNEADLGEGEYDVIEQHGREYLITEDKRLFTLQGKYIGWLNNGVYEPSTKILKRREQERERIDQEARARLFYEKERQKKQRFEEAVKRRMDELRK